MVFADEATDAEKTNMEDLAMYQVHLQTLRAEQQQALIARVMRYLEDESLLDLPADQLQAFLRFAVQFFIDKGRL